MNAILRLGLSRLLMALGTLLLVSAIIFFAVEVLPGDIPRRILGREATPEALAMMRAKLNLDAPAIQRYALWLGGMLQGNFGHSLLTKNTVIDILRPRLFNTLMLSLVAFALYIPLSIVPALIQAVRRDGRVDQAISIVTVLILSTPDFLLATLMLLCFAMLIPVLPPISLVDSGSNFADYARAIVLPAVTLALLMATYGVRMLRDNLIEVLDSDYVRMAELKGLSRTRVLLRHALPNALVPTLNVTALNLAYLIGGVVIVERVFSYPGFGSLLVDVLQLRDVPMVEATVLIAATVYIVANLVADIGAILLNPRLRQG